MLPRPHHLHLIPNPHLPLLERTDLHPQTRTLAPPIDNPVRAHRGTWLIAVRHARVGVDVGQLTARRAARDVVPEGADAGLFPDVFGEGGRACEEDVGAEAEGGEGGKGGVGGEVGGDVVDGGEVQDVDRVLWGVVVVRLSITLS